MSDIFWQTTNLKACQINSFSFAMQSSVKTSIKSDHFGNNSILYFYLCLGFLKLKGDTKGYTELYVDYR